jgi:mycothiol synthase
MMVPLQVSTAKVEERDRALRLFFQLPEDQREAQVQNALTILAKGDLSADGLFVCRHGENVIGAILALVMSGAAGLLWPPKAVMGSAQETVEDLLVESATGWLRGRGAKFAQALLSGAETAAARSLKRRGFRHITTLHYLQILLENRDEICRMAGRLTLQSYATCEQKTFHSALLRSYEGSLDCPEFNGLRTAEEIVAGYQAVPGFQLERCWLAHEAQRPVGVLITAPTMEPATWELLYVGLVPAARRKGYGTELTRAAMAQALAAGATRLVLTVDTRNVPAQRMYASLDLREYDRREVYLALFGS